MPHGDELINVHVRVVNYKQDTPSYFMHDNIQKPGTNNDIKTSSLPVTCKAITIEMTINACKEVHADLWQGLLDTSLFLSFVHARKIRLQLCRLLTSAVSRMVINRTLSCLVSGL